MARIGGRSSIGRILYGGKRHGGEYIPSVFNLYVVPGIILAIFINLLIALLFSLVFIKDIKYEEDVIQNFADVCYQEQYKNLSSYEDNLIIVFLHGDDYEEYYYIGSSGNHLKPEIKELFGNKQSTLGNVINQNLKNDYKKNLSFKLSFVIGYMRIKVSEVNSNNSFICSEEKEDYTSCMINKTDLVINESIIDEALTKFTNETGIPITFVIEDAEDVLNKGISKTSIVLIIISSFVLLILLLFVDRTVMFLKHKKEVEKQMSQEINEIPRF